MVAHLDKSWWCWSVSSLQSPPPKSNMKAWGVTVVMAALLCFSSLHLCRISKLLWCTGCCRKLKLSKLFNAAEGAESSCPWRSNQTEGHKEEREKWREKWQIRHWRKKEVRRCSHLLRRYLCTDWWRKDIQTAVETLPLELCVWVHAQESLSRLQEVFLQTDAFLYVTCLLKPGLYFIVIAHHIIHIASLPSLCCLVHTLAGFRLQLSLIIATNFFVAFIPFSVVWYFQLGRYLAHTPMYTMRRKRKWYVYLLYRSRQYRS